VLLRAGSNHPVPNFESDFWYTRDQYERPAVRDRSDESASTLKASYISVAEIREALSLAQADNAGGDNIELVRISTRMLGFKRLGAELQARIASCW